MISINPKIIAVDPGAEHVGVVRSIFNGIDVCEYKADEWLWVFENLLDSSIYDIVICEAFVLYPGKAKAQSWSPMATSEMIGAMKWITTKAGVEFVTQGADIKIPTRAQCKARGIETKNKSGHASDALLHFWYYALRNNIKMEV